MKTVLLTGGIGSGKSAVSEYLRSRGVPVYDSDSRTKALYDSDPELVKEMERVLGVNLTSEDGKLDRKALASIIFSSPEALADLESVVHPAVLEDFLRWRGAMESKFRNGEFIWSGYSATEPFVVMESAIALEKHVFDGSYDAVVVVDAPLMMRAERAVRRDHAPLESVLKRVSAQKTDISRADAVINNDLDPDTMASRTDIAFKLLYL